MSSLTQLLVEALAGNASARNALFETVYAELTRIACGWRAHGTAPTLLYAPTLVHEAYLRLIERDSLAGTDRNSFGRSHGRLVLAGLLCAAPPHAAHGAPHSARN